MQIMSNATAAIQLRAAASVTTENVPNVNRINTDAEPQKRTVIDENIQYFCFIRIPLRSILYTLQMTIVVLYRALRLAVNKQSNY